LDDEDVALLELILAAGGTVVAYDNTGKARIVIQALVIE